MSDHDSSSEAILTRRQILVAAGTSGLMVTGSWYALGQQPRRKHNERERLTTGQRRKHNEHERPTTGQHGRIRVHANSERVGDGGARSELRFTEGNELLMKMTATASRGRGIRSLGTGRLLCEAEGGRKWGFTMDGRDVHWSDKKDWFIGQCRIHGEMGDEDFDTEFDCESWDLTKRPRFSRRLASHWGPIMKKLGPAEDELRGAARKFEERGWSSGLGHRPRFHHRGREERPRPRRTSFEPASSLPLVGLVALQTIDTTEQCKTSMATTGSVIGTAGGVILGAIAGGPEPGAAATAAAGGALAGAVIGPELGGALATLCG
jgi:hypothetical protein